MYIRSYKNLQGLYRAYWDIAPITDNQLEKKMERETLTRYIGGYIMSRGYALPGGLNTNVFRKCA